MSKKTKLPKPARKLIAEIHEMRTRLAEIEDRLDEYCEYDCDLFSAGRVILRIAAASVIPLTDLDD